MENQLPITITIGDLSYSYGYDVYWGEKGKDLVASPLIQAYRVEGPWQGDDESLYYSFDPSIVEDATASTIEIVDSDDNELGNIVANKYGYAEFDSTVTVTITVSPKLAETFGTVPVNIDGKYTTTDALSEPLTFCMHKNHRIRIEWAKGLVETFRVVTLA